MLVNKVTSRIHTTLLRGQLWTILILSLTSCASDKWEVNPDDVDLGREFRVRTFYSDIQELPETDTAAVAKLIRVYGDFWADYSEDILKLGAFNDTVTISELRTFIAHPSTVETLAAIDTTSAKQDKINQVSIDLENGFKRLHALMPTEPTPDVILMYSGFNYAVYPREETLAIGLEWFMGHEHPIYDMLPPDIFPQYRRLRMHPDLLTANAFRGWMLVNFQNRGYTGRMLSDDILYWGKVLWLTHKCMPQLHEHLLMDWTPSDLKWATANEESIWMELQPSDVIFETNRTVYNRWLTEGPFTKAGSIPQESPDKLGIWMGWQIIEDYMSANSDTSIEELFNERDPSEFLRTYRP